MDDVLIRELDHVELTDPVLIEGLPGVGNVGKLAADYLRDQLKARALATVHSKFFPPQVYVNEEGIIRLVANDISYVKAAAPSRRDLVILGGDYQGISPEGQYELTHRELEFCHRLGVREIYTLAGFAQGHVVETPRVLGAATSPARVAALREHGVVFSRNDPGGGLIGASGLFLGLGRTFDMEGVCLMGETSGYFVDPRSAEAVLKVLTGVLRIDLDFTDLESKAREIDRIAQKIHDAEQKATEVPSAPAREDLGYIG
ncbi:MAG TPA: proteasome assembly chaperone family protein [Thermoplasmata archaeon]|nr:proteasome assembly chaperone family protein [Thermoplasmata archaeon]HUJ77941.1 proteasome assembly chaperone family protein [Thermoplasmata archaeon]